MKKHLAVAFPGQGSQSLGMMDDLVKDFPETMDYFNEASQVLGYDLWQLVTKGPLEHLNSTEKTQPAMLVAGYCAWKAWLASGGHWPEVMAGHSLGEYTALVASEAMSFADGVKLVTLRGQYMQEAMENSKGAMAAIIGLDDGRIEEICREASRQTNEVVTPANYNSIGQVVIAGNQKAVDRAIELANSAGARLAKILPVSVPCHCPLMKPASTNLQQALEAINFSAPKVPVLNNVDVKYYTDAASIKDGLIRQLYSPVKWVETILKMSENGIESIIEVGPGNVLVGLIRRDNRSLKPCSINSKDSIEAALN